MRFLSLFSGIEAASVAWHPLGWECAAVAEVDPFASSVLARHYPSTPNLGDITKITKSQIEQLGHIDLVVGGFPCQDLSVAGTKRGLVDEHGAKTRSGLFFDAMRVFSWTGARFLLLENVPGLLTSKSGEDFSSVVEELLGVRFKVPNGGWKSSGLACSQRGLIEWAVLDSQGFGVPQRRRRVFALADFGDWSGRPPILFGAEDLESVPSKVREQRQDPTKRLLRSSEKFDWEPVAIQGNVINRSETAGPQGVGCSDGGVMYTLTSTDRHAVAYQVKGSPPVFRFLCPVEMEKLQGFPVGYVSNLDARYAQVQKVLGNSFAVPVVRWIGRQILDKTKTGVA